MIEIEGFKAFHGTMRITPVSTDRQPIDITTDWLFKPECNCWYGDGESFPAEICKVVDDQSHEKTADEMFLELGYKCMGNDESDMAYVQNNKRVIYIDKFGYAQLQENGNCYGFRREEIKAVAKKMEEMGW